MLPESRRPSWRSLTAAAVAWAALVVVGTLEPTDLLRAAAALVVLFLPSYLIAWPILRPRMGAAGAFTIAGGLSIGVVIVSGLVLNLLPWGVQTVTWRLYVIFVFVLALVPLRRPKDHRHSNPNPVRHELVLAAIGGVLMVSAVLFARMFAAYPTESFSTLWITPSRDAPASSVGVYIRSEERATTGYRLEVWRNGRQIEAWPDIQLATGQTWSGSVSVESGRIEARLYDLADPGTLYRRVNVLLRSDRQAAQREPV